MACSFALIAVVILPRSDRRKARRRAPREHIVRDRRRVRAVLPSPVGWLRETLTTFVNGLSRLVGSAIVAVVHRGARASGPIRREATGPPEATTTSAAVPGLPAQTG
jgi:hypothetical protein